MAFGDLEGSIFIVCAPSNPHTYNNLLRSTSSGPTRYNLVHYKKDGIIVFDTPVEKMFRYMKLGGHKRTAFKSLKLVGV